MNDPPVVTIYLSSKSHSPELSFHKKIVIPFTYLKVCHNNSSQMCSIEIQVLKKCYITACFYNAELLFPSILRLLE